MTDHLFRLSWVFCPLLFALGCDSDEASKSTPTPTLEPTPEGDEAGAVAEAPVEPKAEQASEPAPTQSALTLDNAALFVVRDKGVVALTDAGFTTIPESGNAYLAGFVHGADGTLYGMTSSNIVRVEGGGLATVVALDYDEVGSVTGFDVGSRGEIWVIGSKGLSEYSDGKWTSLSKSEVGLSEDFAVGVALDAEGEPWAATSESLIRRKDGAWAPAELPKGKTKFLNKMGRGPNGAVYLSTYERLFRLTGEPGQVKIKTGSFESPGAFAFAQATYGAAISGIEDVSIFMPADAAVRYAGKRDLGIGTLSALAVDNSGRVWVGGDGGVAIVGPGEVRATWRSGSVEQVAGQISAIVVRGDGPPLPEAGEIKKGGLEGQIVKDGAGLAEVKVELCESPDILYSRTPCTGAPTHLKGKTDAEGKFHFDDVPLGAYGIAIKDGGKWKITLGAALGSQMKEGAVYDIGPITLEK